MQTRDYLADKYPETGFYCPQLKTSSREAIGQLEQLINDNGVSACRWFLIGSSLGGYFAHYLAEKYALQAVLINPAVKPYRLLKDYPSEQTHPYTGEIYRIGNGEIHDLKALESNISVKNNYLVMLQTGDEVLNYRQAAEKYQHCHLNIQSGGDHSFVGYQEHLPDIMRFFQFPLSGEDTG